MWAEDEKKDVSLKRLDTMLIERFQLNMCAFVYIYIYIYIYIIYIYIHVIHVLITLREMAIHRHFVRKK